MEFKKKYNCPQCHSNNVEEISGDLLGLECGHSFSQQDEEEYKDNQRAKDALASHYI